MEDDQSTISGDTVTTDDIAPALANTYMTHHSRSTRAAAAAVLVVVIVVLDDTGS